MGLAGEFARPAYSAEIDAHAARPEQGDARLKIGDESLVLDARALSEIIAVEKDVAGNGTPLGAGIDIVAELVVEILRVEIIGAGKCGPHAYRPVIRFEMMA